MSRSSSQIEAGDLDTVPTVFIKEFPFGRPGAPIDITPHGSAATGSGVTPPGNSIWAPFCSRLDWEIAQWAKTRRLTSSAFSELLVIPEVRKFNISTYCSTNTRFRFLTGLSCRIAP
jgi:hypothetical protein